MEPGWRCPNGVNTLRGGQGARGARGGSTYGDGVGGLADADHVALAMHPLLEERLLGHGDAEDPGGRFGECGYPAWPMGGWQRVRTSVGRLRRAPGITALQVMEKLFFMSEADRAVARFTRDVDEQCEERCTGLCLWLQPWPISQ